MNLIEGKSHDETIELYETFSAEEIEERLELVPLGCRVKMPVIACRVPI